MFFIIFLLAVFQTVCYRGIYRRIKTNRTFNRPQTMITSSYILISKRVGQTAYHAIGLIFVLATSMAAWVSGAWIVAFTLLLYIYFAMRAQTLIDRTRFEAVDQRGATNPAGVYLKPLAHG